MSASVLLAPLSKAALAAVRYSADLKIQHVPALLGPQGLILPVTYSSMFQFSASVSEAYASANLPTLPVYVG